MQTVIDLILAALPSSGSKVTYRSVYEQVPAEYRGQIRNALKELKAQGLVTQEVVWDGSENIHSLVRL